MSTADNRNSVPSPTMSRTKGYRITIMPCTRSPENDFVPRPFFPNDNRPVSYFIPACTSRSAIDSKTFFHQFHNCRLCRDTQVHVKVAEQRCFPDVRLNAVLVQGLSNHLRKNSPLELSKNHRKLPNFSGLSGGM
jgi:hypothetical protein